MLVLQASNEGISTMQTTDDELFDLDGPSDDPDEEDEEDEDEKIIEDDSH
jgi:hypothetical protein